MENRFSVGAVLGTGFKIWFKNLPAFLLISVVVYIPMIIWGIQLTTGEMNYERIVAFDQYAGLAVLLLNIFTAAAITYGVVMELQGQHAGIGACFATGLARFFPVLGVAILSGLAIGLGFILLIIPGIIVYCMLYVSTPAAVLERNGITGALARSRELTQGHKLEIFGLLFLIGLISVGLTFLAQELFVKGGDIDSISQNAIDSLIRRAIYVQLALNVIISSLGGVMQAVAYYYLRNEKEGTSATELGRIFD
ncbi:MAG: hypothetical protein M4D80_21335 [Myxococcota bacterium]|nr:hypothetical protein [Deltaproteobacteria bacterium]MDQ3337713.1 hypothetical protein [Myxococcota bacterium]